MAAQIPGLGPRQELRPWKSHACNLEPLTSTLGRSRLEERGTQLHSLQLAAPGAAPVGTQSPPLELWSQRVNQADQV